MLLDLRLYRRYEELTQWETFVTKHFPEHAIPTHKQARAKLHKALDPVLLTDPEFAALHAQFRTKIALAIELLEAAIRHKVPFDVGTSEAPVEPGRDWVWREDRVQEFLSAEDADVLFLSGCAQNMGKFLPQFDHVVLLSAPPDVIVERLAVRTNNSYGKHPDQVARVLGLLETVEPLL